MNFTEKQMHSIENSWLFIEHATFLKTRDFFLNNIANRPHAKSGTFIRLVTIITLSDLTIIASQSQSQIYNILCQIWENLLCFGKDIYR